MKINIKYKYWWGKKAKCWIMYAKKYDMSSYGKTKKKAKLMFKENIKAILRWTDPKNKLNNPKKKLPYE